MKPESVTGWDSITVKGKSPRKSFGAGLVRILARNEARNALIIWEDHKGKPHHARLGSLIAAHALSVWSFEKLHAEKLKGAKGGVKT